MSKVFFVLITALLFLVIDLYIHNGLKPLLKEKSNFFKRLFDYIFWGITVLTIAGLFIYNFWDWQGVFNLSRRLILVWMVINYVCKIFVVLFLMFDDILRFFKWIKLNIEKPGKHEQTEDSNGDLISRSEFLMKAGIIAGATPFVAMTWGVISGAHDYRLRRERLYIKGLPKQFDGIRIGQISDIHSGSFFNKTAVQGGVDILTNEKPDVVFFTGDLVNRQSDEINPYFDIFKKVKAPLGVYSTLGNHDYGDYRSWSSAKAKARNLEKMKDAHKSLGWDLLMNENRFLVVDGEKIAVIGVENWGAGRFQKYGELKKAYKGTEESPVKLLLSHDPSHWDSEVRPRYPDIDVMFAGHTHGFQFGIEIGNIKWSPAQYTYKQWAGLYKNNGQQLYVNRGYGYIGYPGRIGILPEVTIFELKST